MSEASEQQMREQSSGTRVLPGGEYYEWNRGRNSTSLIWSSDKSLPELINAADSLLGVASRDHRGLVDFDDNPSTPVSAEEARREALAKPAAVTFLRLEYQSGMALVWTPTPGTEELEQRSSFSEASLLFNRVHASLAAKALLLTATKSVGKNAHKIVNSATA